MGSLVAVALSFLHKNINFQGIKEMSTNKQSNFVFKAKLAIMAGVLALSGATVMADVLNPVIGPLLYEENFNTLDSTVWNSINDDGCGISLCGWGNQELEFYRPANLSIDDVPFEPGTKALAIQAKREDSGGKPFTSGKITTEGKLQVKYGMIEFRMSTPQVGTGLWPAGWMLGTTTQIWPAKGELDIMEMGHKLSYLNPLGSDTNSYTAANAIFYDTNACVPGNESCAASTAWQTKNSYVASIPLVNRFVIYRMYWTDSQIRFTVIDNGVEHDMYKAPIAITAEASEFNAPFYFLFNLAVGGNFTDAANAGQVTAPLPSKMYIDYVRVYKLNGLGEVKLGNQTPKETGVLGIFTDRSAASLSRNLIPGVDSDIWVWNGLSASTMPAYEGANVLAWNYTTGTWFGGSVTPRSLIDMSNFAPTGTLKFHIKIPANVAFKIGIKDNYTNESWVQFPANQTKYGLVRDGEWREASIPVSEIRGQAIALQAMTQLFMFASDGAPSNFQIGIDDVVWDCGTDAACLATETSSSSVGSVASSVVGGSSSIGSSVSSSIAVSSVASSATSSVIVASSSSVATSTPTGNGYTITSPSSVRFYSTDADWSVIHYTLNGGNQENVGMIHNSDNTNTFDLMSIIDGTFIDFFFTVKPVGAGAYDSAHQSFTMGAVNSSSSSSVSSASSVSSTASSAVAYSLVVEAEDKSFDNGGITVVPTQDMGGGSNIVISRATWVAYTNKLTIPATGVYQIEYRVASTSGGSFIAELDGGQPQYVNLGTVTVPATHGDQTWITITQTVTLTQGAHAFGINTAAGGWSFNWFRISSVTSSSSSSVAPSSVSASSVAPSSVPASSVAPSSVPASSIAPSSVPASSVAPSSVPASSVAPSSVPASSVAPSSVPASSVAPSSVPASSVAPSSVPASSVAPSSVPASSVAPSSVPASSVAPSSVAASSVAPSSVAASSIAPSSVPASSVAPSSVPASSVAPSSVAASSIAPNGSGGNEVPGSSVSSVAASSMAAVSSAGTSSVAASVVTLSSASASSVGEVVVVGTNPKPHKKSGGAINWSDLLLLGLLSFACFQYTKKEKFAVKSAK